MSGVHQPVFLLQQEQQYTATLTATQTYTVTELLLLRDVRIQQLLLYNYNFQSLAPVDSGRLVPSLCPGTSDRVDGYRLYRNTSMV
jgi:hypothetical protein